MTIWVYKVKRDYGFAPNPFHGVCTLACCKPMIRKYAKLGDWVIGAGSKEINLLGKVIYAMVVEEDMTFDEYWNHEDYQIKKAVLEGTKKMMYGDNIYHKDPASGNYLQENSHHSHEDGSTNEKNLRQDTHDTDRILISRKYIYFGGDAKKPPNHIDSQCEKGFPRKKARHYKITRNHEVKLIKEWVSSLGWCGIVGDPEAWRK